MARKITLRMKNTVKSLREAREAFESHPIHLCLPTRYRLAVDLVMDELVSNVIKFGGDDRRNINLDICLDKNKGLTLRMADNSGAYNPLTAPKPQDDVSLEELDIGGRGIHIVKGLVDSCRYNRKRGWNRLLLRIDKPIKESPAPSSGGKT